jgi:hypothetical protein
MEPGSTESKAYQATAESLQSTFHEQVVEHIFIAELLQEAWLRYNKVVEVMRSEVDAYGYDLILECQGIVRHVQLKASKHDAATAFQKVGLALGAKPSGCVIWIKRKSPDEKEKEAGNHRFALSYLFFGNPPNQKLPNLLTKIEGTEEFKFPVATRTTPSTGGGYKVREGIRKVTRAHFVPPTKDLQDGETGMKMGELFTYLFGENS